MAYEKNSFKSPKKNALMAGKEIERLGAKISAGCLFYDLTPGGDHDMSDTFIKFIDLIIYCTENKFYEDRDDALKMIQKYYFL